MLINTSSTYKALPPQLSERRGRDTALMASLQAIIRVCCAAGAGRVSRSHPGLPWRFDSAL